MYNSKGLVFPSIYEGFGLPYVEAAHLRTPVIAFENDSVNNLLGKSSAYLHSPGDYRNLISSLPFTLVDPNRKAIIDSAFSKTENLTWENTARKTLEIYNLAID
jgi:glycosyltransferase involved in cell wall biosynthesis